MGLYDRDYYRDEPSRSRWADASITTQLIVANVVIYLADLLLFNHNLKEYGELSTAHPWEVWRLVTYGFLHATNDFRHILFNMLGLWFFGRDVEGVYGPKKCLQMYFTAIIASGAAFLLVQFYKGQTASAVGASGAVMALMLVSVCHFPKRTFFVMFFPVPAWLLAGLYIVSDLTGMIDSGDNVAHVAHLGGVAYGYLFYRTSWTLATWWPRTIKFNQPRLRVHRPDDAPPTKATPNLAALADAILEKITREGESSLTPQERRTLEEASRMFQQQRKR